MLDVNPSFTSSRDTLWISKGEITPTFTVSPLNTFLLSPASGPNDYHAKWSKLQRQRGCECVWEREWESETVCLCTYTHTSDVIFNSCVSFSRVKWHDRAAAVSLFIPCVLCQVTNGNTKIRSEFFKCKEVKQHNDFSLFLSCHSGGRLFFSFVT